MRRKLTSPLMASLASLLLIAAHGVSGYQNWLEQPRYTEVNPNGHVVMKCQVSNKKGDCRWEKDGQPVGIYPGKYVWAGSPETGDCSLRVFNASLEFDDGTWQCQVTPSSFNSKDALISEGAQLVVRESPTSISIQRTGSDGQEVVASAGEDVELECLVGGGNPPATLRWYLDASEIATGHAQDNSRSSADPRKWVSVSKLRLPVSKADNGAAVRCVAEHPTLDPPLSARTKLTIHYPPTIHIENSDLGYLEEKKDEVTLNCIADSNPPAKVIWRKEGLPGIFSPHAEITISPVTRDNAGVYSCTAENELGLSQTKFVELDVKYGPSIENIGPAKEVSAKVGKDVILSCQAKGNPQPSYQWLQRRESHEVVIRGYEKNLVISDVDYDHQGEFVCKATNVINGEERSVQSEAIRLDVSGAPRVAKETSVRFPHEVRVQNGQDASLEVEFCADPMPKQAWHLSGSNDGNPLRTNENPLTLSAGIAHGRFFAETLPSPGKKDCHIAALRINGAHADDTRSYLLRLTNSHGEETHTVHLVVRDHVSREQLIAVVVGAVLALLLLVLVCVYCCKAEGCCSGSNICCCCCGPSAKKNFKPADLESEKTDIESTHSSNLSNFDNANKAIPPDALYASSETKDVKRVSPGLPSFDSGVIGGSKESLRPPSISPKPMMTAPPAASLTQQQQQQYPDAVRPPSRQQQHPIGPPRIVYNDLCFPKTSNYGSMKKKGNKQQQQQQQELLQRLNERQQQQQRMSYVQNDTYA